MIKVTILMLSLLVSANSVATEPAYRSQYIGEEARSIKSLSPQDVNMLLAGKGWGLAKTAELSGYPGPLHVLQMKEKLNLSDVQEKNIQLLYDKMKAEAIPLGQQLVQQEKALDQMFADARINPDLLQQQLDRIYQVYSKLRYTHLVAHLSCKALLSEQQTKFYNELRGYNSAHGHHDHSGNHHDDAHGSHSH